MPSPCIFTSTPSASHHFTYCALSRCLSPLNFTRCYGYYLPPIPSPSTGTQGRDLGFCPSASPPRVQIFRVHNSAPEANNEPRRALRVLDEVNNSWHFGAPLESKYYKSLDESPNKNVSAYMIVSGLWIACKESRRVIRKHFAEH